MLKKILIISSIVALVGIIITGIAIGLGGIRASGAKVQRVTREVSEPFSSIIINSESTNIRIEKSQSESAYAVCHEGDGITFSSSVTDGVLTLSEIDSRKWYQHIGFFFGDRIAVLYLPAESYAALKASVTGGDIECNENITFENADLKASSGSIEFYSNVTGELKASAASGDIELGALSAGSINVKTSAGDIELEKVKAGSVTLIAESGSVDISDASADELNITTTSGGVELENALTTVKTSIKTKSGGISLEHCDSSLLQLESISGRVEASLRTGKVFDVRTSSGSARYPDSVEGYGKCSVKTKSGNIRIRAGR